MIVELNEARSGPSRAPILTNLIRLRMMDTDAKAESVEHERSHVMTPDEMKAVGHSIYHEVIQNGNVDLVDELLAADCIDISPNDLPGIGREGTEPLKQFVQMLHGGLSDVRVTIHELLVDGNTGIGRVTIEGRHTGTFMGIPATNRAVAFDVVDIVKYREGKVREHYGLFDGLSLFGQLGLIPGPEAAATP